MKKIKILYIIDKLHHAGAQVHLSRVIKGFDADNFDCQVFCLLSGGEVADELRNCGIKINVLGINKIYNLKAFLKLFSLVKFIKREKFDIIHNYLFSSNIYGTIAAWIARTPVIITSRRGTGMLREGKFKHTIAYQLTNWMVNKVVCVTKSTEKISVIKEDLPARKLVTIYNGIDFDYDELDAYAKDKLRKECGVDKDDKVVGLIANFNWIKGHKIFIQAAKEIVAQKDNVKFLLIGEGGLKEKIRQRVRALGLEEKILFLGVRNDVRDLVQIMDVSVNASYSEGMSNTILESMAAGIPVVATNVDGNIETVKGFPESEQTGILVPSGDPGAMSKAILCVLGDDDLSRKMSSNAKGRINSNFTTEIMIKEMGSLYDDLIDRSTKEAVILANEVSSS